jgi:hypothetical protein
LLERGEKMHYRQDRDNMNLGPLNLAVSTVSALPNGTTNEIIPPSLKWPLPFKDTIFLLLVALATQSEHLAMSHEIDIDLGCNKEAAMSEFDTFLTEMHCKLWCHSNGCIKNRYGCRLITSEINVESARHSQSSDWLATASPRVVSSTNVTRREKMQQTIFEPKLPESLVISSLATGNEPWLTTTIFFSLEILSHLTDITQKDLYLLHVLAGLFTCH